MKNQSDTFANSETGLPSLQVEKKVETSVSNNHLDTKFTAEEVYTNVWFDTRLHSTFTLFPFPYFPLIQLLFFLLSYVTNYHFPCSSSLSIPTTFKSNYILWNKFKRNTKFFTVTNFIKSCDLDSRWNDFQKREIKLNKRQGSFKLGIWISHDMKDLKSTKPASEIRNFFYSKVEWQSTGHHMSPKCCPRTAPARTWMYTFIFNPRSYWSKPSRSAHVS